MTIHKFEQGDISAGYCSKNLLYQLIMDINDKGGAISMFYLSPEDLDDIREYHAPADEQILETFVADKYWNTSICVVPELADTGLIFGIDLNKPELISIGLIERSKK